MAGNNWFRQYHRLPSFMMSFSDDRCMEELVRLLFSFNFGLQPFRELPLFWLCVWTLFLLNLYCSSEFHHILWWLMVMTSHLHADWCYREGRAGQFVSSKSQVGGNSALVGPSFAYSTALSNATPWCSLWPNPGTSMWRGLKRLQSAPLWLIWHVSIWSSSRIST